MTRLSVRLDVAAADPGAGKALITSAGSWPRSCSSTMAAFRPGAPVIEVRALVLGGELAVRTPPKNRRFRLFSRS